MTRRLWSNRYTANRQPGKALPYFLRLRRSNVFDLIRENNLFTDVRDQVLLLVQFDDELRKQRKRDVQDVEEGRSDAITLLVDNIHSIPVRFHVTSIRYLTNDVMIDRSGRPATREYSILPLPISRRAGGAGLIARV
jgi:hypothetical protein